VALFSIHFLESWQTITGLPPHFVEIISISSPFQIVILSYIPLFLTIIRRVQVCPSFFFTSMSQPLGPFFTGFPFPRKSLLLIGRYNFIFLFDLYSVCLRLPPGFPAPILSLPLIFIWSLNNRNCVCPFSPVWQAWITSPLPSLPAHYFPSFAPLQLPSAELDVFFYCTFSVFLQASASCSHSY